MINTYICIYIYIIYTTIYVSAKKATNTFWNIEKSGNHYTKWNNQNIKDHRLQDYIVMKCPEESEGQIAD